MSTQNTNPIDQMVASLMQIDDPATGDVNIPPYFGDILSPPLQAHGHQQGAPPIPPEILNPPPEGHLNLLRQTHNRAVSRNVRPQLRDDQILRAVHQRLFTPSSSTQPPAENLHPAHEHDSLAPFYNGQHWLNEGLLNTIFEVDFSDFVKPIPIPPQPGIYYIRVENRDGWDGDTLNWVIKREGCLYGSRTAPRWKIIEYHDHNNLYKTSFLKKPRGKLETWGLVQYIAGGGANQRPSLYERVAGVEEGLRTAEVAAHEGYNGLKENLDDIMVMLGLPDEAAGSGSE